MLDDQQIAAEIAKGRKRDEVPRLLAVDNEIVLPVNEVIRVQVTAADVLHAFAMPSFGIKRDAVPGRLNETWFKATREGVYYGQCSELCGTNHAFMPAAFRIVSKERYAQWMEEAKKKFASTDGSQMRIAASAPAVR
jgi:cytochrome c oxidase subunit 2